ncbi:uncharacterized protein [Leptinotarsa decemlineata]|uniref:uncharacterized protein n=1 Tax=Leptinotarsa decemlineata TaxID=7539 RepID=UPI003D305EA1
MVRHYQRVPGSRKYRDYTPETLHCCLEAIANGEVTLREAEDVFGIPKRTICNKLKKQHCLKPGRPTVFSEEEELAVVECIIRLGDFEFPLGQKDLRMIMRDYLRKKSVQIRQFVNNTPGEEWAKHFLTRHPRLSVRFAENIKRSRAGVTQVILTNFVNNLRTVLQGVEPCNIWNYDESNLTDDPGKKKVITKRGVKYPEIIRNSSKSSISLMFAGNAVGVLLPPFVVYKSTNMWSTWVENGPPGCRYSNSTSGWFDGQTFEEWFKTLMLPTLKKQTGTKVMIGDNLSSHISAEVLGLCEENDIRFVCLPPNSTHLTQPLDVAFFRPLKVAWRKILGSWKETEAGRRCPVLPKQEFPRLLKELLNTIQPKQADNLVSGFEKCGIYPTDPAPLIARLPSVLHR